MILQLIKKKKLHGGNDLTANTVIQIAAPGGTITSAETVSALPCQCHLLLTIATHIDAVIISLRLVTIKQLARAIKIGLSHTFPHTGIFPYDMITHFGGGGGGGVCACVCCGGGCWTVERGWLEAGVVTRA